MSIKGKGKGKKSQLNKNVKKVYSDVEQIDIDILNSVCKNTTIQKIITCRKKQKISSDSDTDISGTISIHSDSDYDIIEDFKEENIIEIVQNKKEIKIHLEEKDVIEKVQQNEEKTNQPKENSETERIRNKRSRNKQAVENTQKENILKEGDSNYSERFSTSKIFQI